MYRKNDIPCNQSGKIQGNFEPSTRVFCQRAAPHKMYSSKKVCVVLMKKLCISKVCYFVVQGCKKVNIAVIMIELGMK